MDSSRQGKMDSSRQGKTDYLQKYVFPVNVVFLIWLRETLSTIASILWRGWPIMMLCPLNFGGQSTLGPAMRHIRLVLVLSVSRSFIDRTKKQSDGETSYCHFPDLRANTIFCCSISLRSSSFVGIYVRYFAIYNWSSS